MEVKPDDRCANCHREFAEHNYVPDSINVYRCPVLYQDTAYGFFHGGDPRKFFPSHGECSPKEIANHRKACELWTEAEARGETPEPEKCPSGWVKDEHGTVMHVLKAPYGIGIYTCEWETDWEPMESVDSSDYDDLII